MKEIELVDYQSFISAEARQRYFDAVKDKYDYVCCRDIDNVYYLYLYDCPEERKRRAQIESDFWQREFCPKPFLGGNE